MSGWRVRVLRSDVKRELEDLSNEMFGRFQRVFRLLEDFGPFEVGMPHVRVLRDKLWEIRVSGRDGIARGIYVLATDKELVILRVFHKKTNKTPNAEIELALKRAREDGLL
ncbi:MAG: type II toxin-antitoxin system RelE/ParE family toxin [Proteobacteria bacterium]|nr:type II toxin-antitoxin system RelE/ParE family toxin [Pseudomonadota bacterium]